MMRIILVGDVMLGRLVNEALKTEPFTYPLGDTLPLFKKADLRICNLECVISDIGEPWSASPKPFHFRTDEKNIKTLLAGEIGIVSLANNHIFDYGYDAMFRAMNVLGENAINFAGVGMNAVEAAEPAICKVDSVKVGMIAFTDNEPDWEAQENKPGSFYVPVDEKDKRALTLFDAVKKLREFADILIVSAHWGPNWGYKPLPEHVTFAHRLIDEGADIIFGHSPHIVRGVELYKKRAILYSAGNFIDDYAVDEIERNDESFVFAIDIDKNRIKRLHLYPTIINRFQALMAKQERQKEIISKMQKLCKDLETDAKWRSRQGFLEVAV